MKYEVIKMGNRDKKVSFRKMSEGSVEDFKIVAKNDEVTAQELPDRIIEHLRMMADDDGAYKIDRLQHVLQAATRCEVDGGDDDWVVGTLVHDLGDVLAPFSHAEVAYEIIRPFVREEVAWTIRHHGIFQMIYNKSFSESKQRSREQFKNSPYYQTTIDFCEKWDQCSFDPDYPTESLEHFIPAIKRVFTRAPYNISK
jgi:predicted HD phosphohydrolase